MEVTLSQWGNSVGVRLPREVIDRIHLEVGSRLEIQVEDERIVLTPSRPRYTLDELLAGMTPDKEHPLEDDGPVGSELL